MSTLKTTNIQNASSATTNIALDTSGNVTVGNNVTVGGGITASSGTVVMSSPYTMRNKIINGAMVIDQRNAGASSTNTGVYTVDRWKFAASQASKFTWQQNAGSVTPPAGYSNYLGFTSSSSYSVLATDYFEVFQVIEGFNAADLAWGTSSAKSVTLSFWVRSSLTGTFGGALTNGGSTRSYPFSYTISSANTWEQKTITIAGDTTGTWATNNTAGIYVIFSLGLGSNYQGTAGAWVAADRETVTGETRVVGTSGATWYITGVQLERGTVATPFEYRNYQQELAMCQRYYEQWGGEDVYQIFGIADCNSTNGLYSCVQYYVPKRAAPTVSVSSAGDFQTVRGGYVIGSISPSQATTTSVFVALVTVGTSLTVGQAYTYRANNTANARFKFNAEL